jgi:hypothetical protein
VAVTAGPAATSAVRGWQRVAARCREAGVAAGRATAVSMQSAGRCEPYVRQLDAESRQGSATFRTWRNIFDASAGRRPSRRHASARPSVLAAGALAVGHRRGGLPAQGPRRECGRREARPSAGPCRPPVNRLCTDSMPVAGQCVPDPAQCQARCPRQPSAPQTPMFWLTGRAACGTTEICPDPHQRTGWAGASPGRGGGGS